MDPDLAMTQHATLVLFMSEKSMLMIVLKCVICWYKNIQPYLTALIN